MLVSRLLYPRLAVEIEDGAASGQSAGSLLAEYVRDMLGESEVSSRTVSSDMDAVIDWANALKRAAEADAARMQAAVSAAEASTGYDDIDEDRISTAFANRGDPDFELLPKLREDLADAASFFEDVGGRGVELADKIDDLRIVVAALEAWLALDAQEAYEKTGAR
jgi:hypothetical protein